MEIHVGAVAVRALEGSRAWDAQAPMGTAVAYATTGFAVAPQAVTVKAAAFTTAAPTAAVTTAKKRTAVFATVANTPTSAAPPG